MLGRFPAGRPDYVKFRGGRDALGPVFPLFAPCDCRGHLQPGYARAERHLRHPDVGPVQGQNPLGLRFLRSFRLARTVECDRLANERLEGGLVNFFSFVDVDRAACVSVETRVEETGRILQRRALGEGKFHSILVGFAGADDAVMRPNRSGRTLRFHPLPLLDDVRVCLLDELAHSAESFPAPVPELGDSFRDELRCPLALARVRLFHVLILEESGSRSVARGTDRSAGAAPGPRSQPVHSIQRGTETPRAVAVDIGTCGVWVALQRFAALGGQLGVSVPNCLAYSAFSRCQPPNFIASPPTMRPMGVPLSR